MNRTFNVAVNGRAIRVSYLNGLPWYAETYVRLDNLSVRRTTTRTIWHRASLKPLSGLAAQAFRVAEGQS